MQEIERSVHTRLLPDGYQIIRDESGDTFLYHEAHGVVSGRFNAIDVIRVETDDAQNGEFALMEREMDKQIRLFGRTGSMSQPLIQHEKTGFYRAGVEYTDIDYVPGVGVCGGHGSMKYLLGEEGLPISDRGYQHISRESDGRLWGDAGTVREPVRIVPEGSVRVPR